MFQTLQFYIGQELKWEDLADELTCFGYRRQDRIQTEGEFAIRGGTVDLFPVHFAFPVRLDLSHRTIEDIHAYDPETGIRLEPHQMVVVLPVKTEKRFSLKYGAGVAKGFIEQYASSVEAFVDVKPGDYVVHVLHGIAKFRGIKPLRDKTGMSVDHFSLEYAGKTILYVPTQDLHLIQRYVGFGKIHPSLSKLGTKGWQRLKERARKGVLSFAGELLAMQAKRAALKGISFAPDTEWQKKLEEEFPFQETPDQITAVAEVKKDLESTVPMDRLLCGDVGYGKTEVALRAAFKVVLSGRQVAILVPTTLLAEQHYETFIGRMKNFPVQIRMLSRFQTKSEQDLVVQSLSNGGCDIVIGTHRLLSSDIAFKNLGLVVIDEEQRFGVRHKEHLKKLRLLVDVLTLTATPIPRTLYLSLVGAKDMSTINTPPKNRQPIQTLVRETDDKIISEAILRELSRKGQVFFIHNRVQGIEFIANKLHLLVPHARIQVGHGQMPSKSLEEVMHRFIHGQVDVLVSTTIVESGIDIPNANTIIINRADTFGLSELYQLRGRVGRFDRSAYAYLLVPKKMALTLESVKRLDAMEKYSYLGSGFNLAMEDLEIRGAGNILGTEQHGYICNIGFDLYCRILKETIEYLKRYGETAEIKSNEHETA